ncbi:Uncharacterised protein [Candidatus Burarchaeum australiense]|nr:Uncharacterised protein [Candidatus Burarchaeum australiense]
MSASAEGNSTLDELRTADGRINLELAVSKEISEEISKKLKDVPSKITFMGATDDIALSKNLLIQYEVRLGCSMEDVKKMGETSWEVDKVYFWKMDDLHERVANVGEKITPSGIFGLMLLGLEQFGPRWLDDVGRLTGGPRQA